nr:synaptobrevin, longin-like domain protein [Tanacetum cinerariifolium]
RQFWSTARIETTDEGTHILATVDVKPTIFVSHIRQFWSTARIETTDEGTHILATVDGIHRTVSETSLRRNLKLRDDDGIVSILEFSSNIATALVCLATNRTYNFSKMIFDGMIKNINNKTSKFLMYPRIVPHFDTMFVHQGEGSGTPTEPHHTPFPEANTSSHPTTSSIPLPSIPTTPIPPVTQPDPTPIKQYSSLHLLVTIVKSSTLPHDSAPRVTSPVADEGSMQHNISELTALCTSLQRQYSEPQAKFQAQEVEIVKLKDSVKVLEDREATVLAGETDVPIGSGSIPTVDPPATIISTSSEVGPTASPIVLRRKGKEVMVESDTPKKKKLQEEIDAQVVRELEEQQVKEDMRMNEQIARDAEVVRIHVEEELLGMIDSLDQSNETVAKYLQEYQDFASELPLEKRIELISDL